MVQRLFEHLALFEKEKIEIETADTEAVVKELVADYEVKVRKELEDKRAKNLEAKDVEINAIKRLIEIEQRKEEEEAQARFLAFLQEQEKEKELESETEKAEDGNIEVPETAEVTF